MPELRMRVAVGLGVGRIPGMEVVGHRPDALDRMSGGRWAFTASTSRRAEWDHHSADSAEIQRMNAGVGAGTAFYVGAGADHRLQRVLKGRTDGGGVGWT